MGVRGFGMYFSSCVGTQAAIDQQFMLSDTRTRAATRKDRLWKAYMPTL